MLPAISRSYNFVDDFMNWAPGADNWVVTEDATATIGIADAAGGVLSIVNDGADDDHVYVQWAYEIGAFVARKRAFFECRLQNDVIDQSDIYAGLYVRDTDPVGGITDAIEVFVDGEKVATAAVTNLPPDELTPSFAVQNGDGAAVTLLIDYIAAQFER